MAAKKKAKFSVPSPFLAPSNGTSGADVMNLSSSSRPKISPAPAATSFPAPAAASFLAPAVKSETSTAGSSCLSAEQVDGALIQVNSEIKVSDI